MMGNIFFIFCEIASLKRKVYAYVQESALRKLQSVLIIDLGIDRVLFYIVEREQVVDIYIKPGFLHFYSGNKFVGQRISQLQRTRPQVFYIMRPESGRTVVVAVSAIIESQCRVFSGDPATLGIEWIFAVPAIEEGGIQVTVILERVSCFPVLKPGVPSRTREVGPEIKILIGQHDADAIIDIGWFVIVAIPDRPFIVPIDL